MRIREAKFVCSALRPEQCPRDGRPEFAFVGRSNVGKSSLINTLLGRRRLAQTSSTPGKTRMLNFYLVNENVFFVDLPGYGYAKVAKDLQNRWSNLVEPYIRDRETLTGVIHLIDCRHEPTQNDSQLSEWLDFYKIPSLPALPMTFRLVARSKISLSKRVFPRTMMPS